MDNYQALKVFYNDVLVGSLYKSTSRLTAFKYDDEWLINGFSIFPFSLHLIKKEFTPSYDPFLTSLKSLMIVCLINKFWNPFL